ncbi:MAG: hypothetical protein WCY09_07950 [Candidatus Omnitrophota bacterium]
MGLLRILPVVLLTSLIAFGPSMMSAAPRASVSVLAAEAAPASAGPLTMDWQGVISTTGVAGVLVWYLYYTTAFSIPKTRQEFREELTALRAHYDTTLATQRAHDDAVMARRDQQMDKLCSELSSLATQLARRPCIRVGEGEA